jgi:hypothetical protein
MKGLWIYGITIVVFLPHISLGQANSVPMPQDASAPDIALGLRNEDSRHPIEKSYIISDQDVYLPGETLWFSLYVSAYGKLTPLSALVYTQLLDAEGKPLLQQKAALKEGHAYGQFNLPDSLAPGWYHLRCLTSWMLNEAKPSAYDKLIRLLPLPDSLSSRARLAKPYAPAALPPSAPRYSFSTYHIHFFPEGGNLVDSCMARVAFMATDALGRPAYATLTLLDDRDSVYVSAHTLHEGMGSFSIYPSLHLSLRAVVRYPNKETDTVTLPPVQPEGISLKVSQDDRDKIQLNVNCHHTLKDNHAVLAAFQQSGKIFTYGIRIAKGLNEFTLDKKLFDQGILRLTIVDAHGLPLAERLVFNEGAGRAPGNAAGAANAVVGAAPSTNPDSAVDAATGLTLLRKGDSLRISTDRSTNGHFTIEIKDPALSPEDSNADDIHSYLLLSSELSSRIPRPRYYFQNQSDSLKEQLDLVMLTYGWRNFTWARVWKTDTARYGVEKYQYLAGHLDQKIAMPIIIYGEDASKFVGEVQPDSNGNFILEKDFTGNQRIYLLPGKVKKKNVQGHLHIFPTLFDTLSKVNFPLENYPGEPVLELAPRAYEFKISYLKKAKELPEIRITASRTSAMEKLLSRHVSPLYETTQSYDFDLVDNDYPNPDWIGIINGKVPGLRIILTAGKIKFFYRGGDVELGRQNDNQKVQDTTKNYDMPYCYLNDASTTLDELLQIPVSEIALIRYVPPPVSFAPYNGGNNGALCIYTKQAGEDPRQPLTHNTYYTFMGYALIRQWSSRPGTESTMYWNPDAALPISIPLPSGHPYRLEVDGMDDHGDLTHFVWSGSPF